MPVHIMLSELEATPVEAVVAAVTFVGIRRQILVERRRTCGQDIDVSQLRASLTVNAQNEEGLANDCLALIVEEAADRPTAALAEQLHRAHGLHPVLAMASFAKALGSLLLEPPDGFPTYNELYFAELAWMSGRPYESCA
ncbi:MAG: hypothetical protein ABI776_10245 [Nocardioidaceae bacterium]